jgi:Rho termination factor, N-terminal domain
MGLDPIQHQLTLSIVCAVQASGCFLISRAVAKLRSDWLRPPVGQLRPSIVGAMGPDQRPQDRLPEVLQSIEPEVHHQLDLQAWDHQFAQVLLPVDRLIARIEPEFRDPWNEQIGVDLLVVPVEALPVEELPVEALLVAQDLLVETLPVSQDLPVLPQPIELPIDRSIELNTLFALTVPQLRSHAKQLGLKNYSRQTKAQLLVAIRRHLESKV